MAQAGQEGYLHTFQWPHAEPQGVIVTGTFDNWSSSVHLHRDNDNTWTATVPLPYGQTVLYKYVVDGEWKTHHDQPIQQDGSGNQNNSFTVPEQGIVAEVKQILEPHSSVGGALEAAGAVAATGLGATAAAIGGILGFNNSESTPATTAEQALPVNHVPSNDTPNLTAAEKPAEPAPSPTANNAQTSLPTVPSHQDLQQAVDKDPKPSSANLVALGEDAKKEPELSPLAPLAPPEGAKQNVPTDGTSVEAAGKDASAATGSNNDGEGFLRLTEEKGKAVAGAAAAAVGVGAVAGAGVHEATKAKEVEPVKGIEVYKADGSVGTAGQIETAKAEDKSHSAAGAAGASSAATTAQQDKPLPPPISTTLPISSTAETKAAAASKKSSPPPTTSNDVFSNSDKPIAAASTAAPKAATVSKATSGKSYDGLGQKKADGKAATIGKATGLTANNNGGPASSAPNTPSKEEVFKTAPTTPATPADGKKHEGRQRTSSFFTKVKMALSPSKSKK